MPWDPVKLNDGHSIPGIAFGTWKLGLGQASTDLIEQALSVGFSHVDTAQIYANETEAGIAIRESGLARNENFVTTKYSRVGELDIGTSVRNSLKNLGLSYIDLYLIHHPRVALPDIPTAWKKMQELKEQGLVKSIGVSNFELTHLQILLDSAKIKPAANQILLHPYVYSQQIPILEYCAANNIAVEAYSPLIPLTSQPGGPVDTPVKSIADRLGVSMDQVLLAWARTKGAIVITMSTKRFRLEGYLHAGDLNLTADDIASIDKAGAEGSKRSLPALSCADSL